MLSSVIRIAGELLRRVEHNKDYSIRITDERGFRIRTLANNEIQITAIRAAMTQRLTLIQGPPGQFLVEHYYVTFGLWHEPSICCVLSVVYL